MIPLYDREHQQHDPRRHRRSPSSSDTSFASLSSTNTSSRWEIRTRRFIHRHIHSRPRTYMILSTVLVLSVLYVLWPSEGSEGSGFTWKAPSYHGHGAGSGVDADVNVDVDFELDGDDGLGGLGSGSGGRLGSGSEWQAIGGIETPYAHTEWPKERRAEAVKEAFLHAWDAYEKFAMRDHDDEVRPLTNGSVRNFNGWGVTMYDALDTLWLMDLKPQYNRVLGYVEKGSFWMEESKHAMFFETTIRYLGGLLSAYALSGDPILLTKADELGKKLLPAFEGMETGMPVFAVNTVTGEVNLGPRKGKVIIAEFASCQMEYKYLAHLTGKKEYFLVADRVMDYMEKGQLDNGMWYTTWNGTSGEQADQFLTIGAWADSAYEYLLKQYLMSGRSETRLRDMYLKSTRGVLQNILFLSPTRDILYVTDAKQGRPSHSLEHLSCFYPGLLALGASTLTDEEFRSVSNYPIKGMTGDSISPVGVNEKELHMWAAEGLAYSCWLMYADQPSGLAPEIVGFFRHPKDVRPVATKELTHEEIIQEAALDGRWIDRVRVWKESGAVSGLKPPGVMEEAKPMPAVAAETKEKDYRVKNSKYLLRPETIESLYVLWRTTHDEVWRDRGWQIFLSIERMCRTPTGYASVLGVNRRAGSRVQWLDEMPSYALAETWKYLYLMFLDYDPVPMDKFVFNTEAHPLPIFEWDEWEKAEYGIR